MNLYRLGSGENALFPNPDTAQSEPDGLLAWGGDLAVGRLRSAYAQGIFPWYSEGQPILWWSPAQRAGFDPKSMHIPRRLQRWLRSCPWTLATDTRFDEVVTGCAAPRRDDGGTWILPEMRKAYSALHRAGDAHSIEVLDGNRLVGGLYGVASGGVFCAESMFSAETHASKVALLALAGLWARTGGVWIDAQIPSAHLAALGAVTISRDRYLALLSDHTAHVSWPRIDLTAATLL